MVMEVFEKIKKTAASFFNKKNKKNLVLVAAVAVVGGYAMFSPDAVSSVADAIKGIWQPCDCE